MPLKLAGFVIAIFSASAIVVAIVKRWASRRLLDVPGARSSHVHPTPRGGGLAIAVVALASWIFFARSTGIALPLAGAAIVAAVSWFDDLKSLPWSVRILAQSIAAALVLVAIWPLPAFGSVPLVVRTVIAFAWIVGLTNAYNFMDGIDGIAAGQAIVAGGGWALLGWIAHDPLPLIAGLTLLAASGGFLIYNWPPASIFMGDVGAAFLGFTLAALPLMVWHQQPQLAAAGPLLVWPFLFDTSFTFFRRLYRGENVVAAHRSHLYQRLVITGMSHGQVSLIYATMALFGVAASVAIAASQWTMAIESVISVFAAAVVLYIVVVRREAHTIAEKKLPSS